MRSGGELEAEAFAGGVEVRRVGFGTPGQLRDFDVCQGWMYPGAVAASLLGGLAGIPVSWSLRHVPDNLALESNNTRVCLRVMRYLAGDVAAAANSQAAVAVHERHGIHPREWTVIANGIDPARFRRDPEGGRQVRRRLGLDGHATVLLSVGRWHPHKGQDLLLSAGTTLLIDRPEVHLVIVGRGGSDASVDPRIRDRVHLVQEQQDVRPYLSAADVLVNPSRTESFPTIVAEAMSCEIVVVATDVGDTRRLQPFALGRPTVTGIRGMVERALALSAEQRGVLGLRGRRMIEDAFTLERAVASHEAFLDSRRSMQT